VLKHKDEAARYIKETLAVMMAEKVS